MPRRQPKLTKSEQEVFEALTASGYEVLRNGWPDFLARKEGETIAVEVKRSRLDPLSEEQALMHAALRDLGITTTTWVKVGDGNFHVATDHPQRGRGVRHMATPRSNIVKLRLTDLEKADWQKAAGGQRLLSDFIRRTVNAECEKCRGGEARSVGRAAGDAPEVAGRRPATTPAPPSQCPRAHHHRPGRYCGTCKKVATKMGE